MQHYWAENRNRRFVFINHAGNQTLTLQYTFNMKDVSRLYPIVVVGVGVQRTNQVSAYGMKAASLNLQTGVVLLG